MLVRSIIVSLGTIAIVACSTDAPTNVSPVIRTTSGSSSSMPEATPDSFTILPNEVVGGDSGTPSGKVTVTTVASFDRFMHLSTNHPEVLPFLSSGVTVPANSPYTGVQIIPSQVSTPTVVTIFVTGNGVTVSADLLVDPPGTPPPPPTLSSYTVSPSTVSAGTTATGTVTLPSAAPSGGVVVSLSSRVPASASVPSSVTVPQGATTVSFPVSTFAGFPNSTTSVLLSASNVNTVLHSSITVVTGGTASTSLAAPALMSPSADARFARGSTITFDWSDVPNASSYTIQIGSRDNFPSPLIANQTITLSTTAISGLPAQTMWWRVRASSSDGTSSAWSSVRRFELK